MKLVYTFTATHPTRRERISGLIDAQSRASAIYSVKKMGLERIALKLNISQTIYSLISGTRSVSPPELARFYQTLSRRLLLRMDEAEILRTAQDYLIDGRMRSAAAIMYAQRRSNVSLGQSMLSAGLPERDASVIMAIESRSAQKASAFADLARETQERFQLGRDLKGLFRMPKVLAAIVWFAGGPFLVLLIMPVQIATSNQFDITLPSWIAAYYAAITWLNDHLVIATIIYLAVPAGLIALLKSSFVQKQVERISVVKRFLDLREHAALWGSFAMLYGAGEIAQRICVLLRKTVSLPNTAQCLDRMARAHLAGRDNIVAVRAAMWPRWVESALIAAYQTDFEEEMNRSVMLWREDLAWQIAALKFWAKMLDVLSQTLVVGIFAFNVSVIPAITALAGS